jgi:hypothetical protein
LGVAALGFGAIQIDPVADLLPKVQQQVHLNRPADLTIPAEKSLEAATNPPEDIKKLLVAACYDCHSAKTEWPWYSHIAPPKWFVIEHVVKGRKHLNFATFAEDSSEDRAHRLEECADETAEKHMPLESYTWLHSAAKLSDADRTKLVEWFKAEAQKLK